MRVVQQAAAEHHHVGLPGAQDGFGLLRIVDLADRNYRHADGALDLGGESDLIAGPSLDLLGR